MYVSVYQKQIDSPWDWGHIGIKLGTKQVIYQTVVNFMKKKDIYVNRLQIVIFGM